MGVAGMLLGVSVGVGMLLVDVLLEQFWLWVHTLWWQPLLTQWCLWVLLCRCMGHSWVSCQGVAKMLVRYKIKHIDLSTV